MYVCPPLPTFQKVGNAAFANLPNCAVYIDDIIILSNTEEDHFNHIENVLQRLSKYNLTIQFDKKEFFQSKLPFLGHIVSCDWLKPNPDKIQAIVDFPVPKTEKEIRQFLGLSGYYRKCIQGYYQTLDACIKIGGIN